MWLAGVVLAGVLLSPPPPEAIRRAVAQVYADPAVQRDLPSPRPPSTRPRPPETSAASDVPSSVGGVATALFWGMVALATVALVVALARGWARRRAASAGATVGRSGRPVGVGATPEPAPPADAADALAAQGRFDEAVHLLLVRAVALLRAGGRGVPSHWTSREVAGGADLDGPARAAFDVLVGAVELSLFGGRPLGPRDWEAARAAAARVVPGSAEPTP